MTGFDTLTLAVRGAVVVRYLGELLTGMAVVVGVPALFALATGQADFAARAVVVLVVVMGAGLVCRRREAPSDLQANESLVVVALIFVAGAAAMTWPLMSEGLGVWDALFESVSALTTTGLTTVADIESTSAAFLFARAWMQWCGGLVIVALALALVVEPGPAARRLFGSDVGVVEGTRQRARHALAVYAVLLGLGVLLLGASGIGLRDAVLHGMTSVSTGGFSTHNGSIADLGGLAQFTVVFLAVCGAAPLVLYPAAWRGGWRPLLRDRELRALLIGGAAISAVMVAVLVAVEGRSLADSLRAGPLLAFAAQTTSGFEAIHVADLSGLGQALLLLPMLVGGALGSTAGGIKLVRGLVLLRVMRLVVRRTRLPTHAVPEELPAEAFAMLGLIGLYLAVVMASWLLLLALQAPALDALFEVVSAVGTVGLSSGVTSAGLPMLGKLVLCADMLMGRLEIVAILVLVYPGTWIGRKAS